MKKGLLPHIALIVVAVGFGWYLADNLTKRQLDIDKARADLANSPIAGFHKFASDIEWMFFINYLGSLKTVEGDNIPEVTKRLEKIIALDPNFAQVYQDGVLSLSVADPEKTVLLLEKACDNDYLKTNWQIPFYAGFVVSHHEKKPNYAKAAKFFQMALQRSGSKPESYIVNSFLRAKAKEMYPDKDDKFAMLKILYDEWKKDFESKRKGMAPDVGGGAFAPETMMNTSIIPDLTERLLKAAQEAKNSESPTPELLSLVSEIRQKVLAGQHLCPNCLAPYAAGDKYCSTCGKPVDVWGICKKCGAVLKGKFCPACGEESK
jgi:hypothetical protein